MTIFNDPIGWLRLSVGTKLRLWSYVAMHVIFVLFFYDHFFRGAAHNTNSSIIGLLLVFGVLSPLGFAYAGYRVLQKLDGTSSSQKVPRENPIIALGLLIVLILLFFIAFRRV